MVPFAIETMTPRQLLRFLLDTSHQEGFRYGHLVRLQDDTLGINWPLVKYLRQVAKAAESELATRLTGGVEEEWELDEFRRAQEFFSGQPTEEESKR